MVLAADPPDAISPSTMASDKADGAVLVDQGHRALVQVVGGQEGFVGRGQDVDNGVADGRDIKTRGHRQVPG